MSLDFPNREEWLKIRNTPAKSNVIPFPKTFLNREGVEQPRVLHQSTEVFVDPQTGKMYQKKGRTYRKKP